jgi:aryl-alcohol dehydrogenase-like predicted oxidoreductase
MLTGKLTSNSIFESDDHRANNRYGEYFDRGETFSGVDYETGLKAVDELRALLPAGWSMPQFALRWILMFEAVTCAIPGAKTAAQADDNTRAADLPSIPSVTMVQVRKIYDKYIRDLVHHYW